MTDDDKHFRVSVDLAEGSDFTERFHTLDQATARADELLSGRYILRAEEKHGREGQKKLIYYPLTQLKSVTVDHDER